MTHAAKKTSYYLSVGDLRLLLAGETVFLPTRQHDRTLHLSADARRWARDNGMELELTEEDVEEIDEDPL